MEEKPPRVHVRLSRLTLRLIRVAAKLVAILFIILVTILLVHAWQSRARLETSLWQQEEPGREFRASDARRGVTFEGYLDNEKWIFDELEGFFVADGAGANLRYVDGGRFDPRRHGVDWNRTIELEPEGDVRGGALLMHGLTDSPYSLHTLAELLQAEGFYVVCLRLPGHGTVPTAMLDVSWRDWAAAAEIAAEHVRARVGPDRPFYVAGYSMGGALAVRYTALACEADPDTAPDRVLLFSPAIGVTGFARISNIHVLVSWIPYFHDYRWLSVEPEYDPFKYVSFPKNAGRQMWLLTDAMERALVDAKARGTRLPPVLTFQSIVDETVVARQIHVRLYERLGRDDWELVLFDLNRFAGIDAFYGRAVRETIETLERAELPYELTVITNADPDSRSVVAHTKPAGVSEIREQPLDLEWPDDIFSMSHIAIPFTMDDPVYGLEPTTRLPLGRLALRGERRVLRISPGQMLRVRCNPFHDVIDQRVREAIAVDLGTVADRSSEPVPSAP